jgi:puromycin-sensitive aminopeptidase
VEPSYRLPRNVEPHRYELTLTPDLDAFTFAGEERVHVAVHEEVRQVVLNALDIEIRTAELVDPSGNSVAAAVSYDPAEERAVLTLDQPAVAGEWWLHLTFTGVISESLRGWYRSTFTDESGETRVIATTQFEATDARRAFPCWDEPDRKAVFSVTLIVDDGLLAVSNGPVAEDEDLGNGKRQIRFGDTMPMSTYLVALVVGPLVATTPVDVDGTPVRIVCVPGKEHLGGFSTEVAAHSLRYFARYFDIPYPAEKLDLIGLPDFAMGAMENLGAVTFRESLLLIDPAAASRVELERIADVVAHEVAHMWFGDLVTMKWWNGIWLNEAFATFMELLCVDDFRPDWQRWVSFGLTRGGALGTDALASTRPIEYRVSRPSEAEEMFDTLTYQKGGGVLRMLEQYLGADEFRRGIAAYIAKHRYGNTETTDLWDALEAATGEPVRSTMDSWIYQGGHPVVAVSVSEDGTSVVLAQRRFRFVPAADDDVLWRVPVLLRASVDGEVVRRRFLLTEATESIELGGAVEWVVVNEGGWGVYRVRYSSELLRAVTAQLGDLDALERFNLASDTWASVLAGDTPLDDFVQLAELLATVEDDPNVWAVLVGGLELYERAAAPEAKAEVRALVRSLCRPAFDRLGWTPQPGEPETAATLRASLVRALGVLGEDEDVRARAVELHADTDPAAVDPDLAGALVAIVAKVGGEAAHADFIRRWRGATTPQEELRYLYGLTGFEHPALVRRTLDLTLSEVRAQNAPFMVSLLLANRGATADTWAFTKEHWDELLALVPENLIDRMIDGVLATADPATIDDVRSFLAAHPVPGRAKQIEQLLERLAVNLAFAARI